MGCCSQDQVRCHADKKVCSSCEPVVRSSMQQRPACKVSASRVWALHDCPSRAVMQIEHRRRAGTAQNANRKGPTSKCDTACSGMWMSGGLGGGRLRTCQRHASLHRVAALLQLTSNFTHACRCTRAMQDACCFGCRVKSSRKQAIASEA